MIISETNKKIKIILSIAAVLIVAGLVGYSIYAKRGPIYNIFVSDRSGRDASQDEKSEGLPTGENAVESFDKCKNDSLGSGMLKKDQSDAYYLAARALIKKDKEICSEADDLVNRDVCFQYYDRFSLLSEKNEGKDVDCGKLQSKDDQSMCLAITKNDVKSCDSISAPLLKELCKANTTLDAKYCDGISAPVDSQGACRKIRESGSDEDVNCGVIEPERAKLFCNNSLNFIKALRDKDPGLCDKIDPETGKFDILLCRVLTNEDPEKSYQDFFGSVACMEKYAVELAKAENDPAVCEQIPLKEKYNKSIYDDCKAQFEK